MRILYVASRFDYGDPSRGLSFEHYNFHQSLTAMGHDLVEFDYPTLLRERGRAWMNRRLAEMVRAEKPNLLFAVAGEELDRRALKRISDSGDTVTLNWFCDDHWRFESFSRPYAPCFNWVVTTSQGALVKYEQLGVRQVIKSQWGCNHHLYRKLDLPLCHDVSFVGLPHGQRRQVVAALRGAGIRVACFGLGWEHGRISQDQMIRVFNQSRINLNFAEASAGRQESKALRWLRRGVFEPLRHVPGGWRVEQAARAAMERLRPAAPPPLQIKGRNFEAPGCGGFLLTNAAENLADYYEPGREMALFDGTADLVEKVRYYLAHEDERAAIALAGYRRTLREHTYAHRFTAVFREMWLEEPAERPRLLAAA